MARAKRRSRRSAANGHQIMGDVLTLASTLAETPKRVAADRLSEVASATRRFTTTVEDFPYLRDYADVAAGRIDEFADYVDRTKLPEMFDDIVSFAKRKPMAALALGVAAGLVTTQLMRSRVPEQSTSETGHSKRKRKRKR